MATRPPGNRERPSLSLGYKLGGAFRPLQDLLGAQRPLLESTLRHKVPTAGKSNVSAIRIDRRSIKIICLPSFRENKCFGTSLYLSDLALFEGSNELSTLLFCTVLWVGIRKLKVVLQSAKTADGPAVRVSGHRLLLLRRPLQRPLLLRPLQLRGDYSDVSNQLTRKQGLIVASTS